MSARYRIGFDIGGTFTDFILLDSERADIRLHKCLTTPRDPSIGALEGLAEAVAVCFLHAYRNPAHERAAGAAIRAAHPDLSVSLSSDVVAELWEYQRLTTTCANAFVQPLMDRYVHRLERELWQRGFRGALYLMHSA